MVYTFVFNSSAMIMYSFKYTHSTCKYFIEIKSQIDDYCLSVRNDETRICKKYLCAVFFLESCYVRSNRSCNIRMIMDVHNVCPHGNAINTISMLVALPCGHTFCGPPRVYIEGVADGNKGMKCRRFPSSIYINGMDNT